MKKIIGIMLAAGLILSSFGLADLETKPVNEFNQNDSYKVLNFRTHLSGMNEVPPVETEAEGQAIFKLSKDGTMLTYKILVDNIDNVVASHIHLALAGANGGVVATLFSGGPTGSVEGLLVEGSLTSASLTGALAGMTLMDLVDKFYAGKAYVNVHTTDVPSGEIRGQVFGNMPSGGVN